MKKIAVILAGCGVYDGSEIHETVLTLLNIEKLLATYQCFAPNINQHQVIDHLTNQATEEQRNVLNEAARIARGDIKKLSELDVQKVDGLIIPGGFGVAKNLSDFALQDLNININAELEKILKLFLEHKKPVGLMCIAGIMAGKVYGSGTAYTIGNDEKIINKLAFTDAVHVNCTATETVIDTNKKLVTTPAYMLAQSLTELERGIAKLVKEVIDLT